MTVSRVYREARFNVIEAAAFVATFPCTGNQSGRGSEANFPAGEGERNNPTYLQLILAMRGREVTLLELPWILCPGNQTENHPPCVVYCVIQNVYAGFERVD